MEVLSVERLYILLGRVVFLLVNCEGLVKVKAFCRLRYLIDTGNTQLSEFIKCYCNVLSLYLQLTHKRARYLRNRDNNRRR